MLFFGVMNFEVFEIVIEILLVKVLDESVFKPCLESDQLIVHFNYTKIGSKSEAKLQAQSEASRQNI